VGNVITRVDNGAGGVTAVTYMPSSSWTNTYLPVGVIIQTVSRVATTDGRSPTWANTDYTYAGGLWLDRQRRFLGFRKVTGVVDAAGDYSETYYRQNIGSLSKVETTYFKSAAGTIFSYSQYGYT